MRISAVLTRQKGFILSVITFLLIAFALTFGVISLPALVIGDNFNWTPQNIIDITGPKVIRESYMGDIAVLSAFKTGFLFPLTYSAVSLNLPSTIVYPFLFYFLSMLSFYFLAKEFLKSTLLAILVSVLYVINPVTPYYFASLINAFSLVLLPLGIKFFVRTLREVQKSTNRLVLKNLAITAFFLSLVVSANEQFILSIVLIVTAMVVTLGVMQFRKHFGFIKSGKAFLIYFFVIASVFCLINGPLLLSTVNVQKAAWSTYFQGPSSARFFATIDYTYGSADLSTILRFGGDSGTGFGNNSWYDSNMLTNVFGYVLLVLFIASVILLFLKKEPMKMDRTFFIMSAALFLVAFALILFMKGLPTIFGSAGISLDSLLKTWENPGKLRVVLLVSALITTLALFSKLEVLAPKNRNKLLTYSLVIMVAFSTIAYNSPWLISYAGKTTLQGIADASNWDSLYQQELAKVTSTLDNQEGDQRAIVLPYTHAAELYASPRSRVFQLVSQVNGLTSQLIPEQKAQWSKTLGLFSIKSVAVKNAYNSSELPIFPSSISTNGILANIKNDAGFSAVSQVGDYQILDNRNALPMLYASRHYVYYDDIGTLKYAFNYVNFDDLPVFLNAGQEGGLALPTYAPSDNYTLYALTLKQKAVSPSLLINVNNDLELHLTNQEDDENLTIYSGNVKLTAGDFVSVPALSGNPIQFFNDLTLSSNISKLGNYGSFTLDFKVNVLQKGNYSFLGPRVMLDSGDKQYYIIIHDNGMLELATMDDGGFTSAKATCLLNYSLKDPQSQLDVKVVRYLDEVEIYVDGVLCMTFTTESKYVDLYLTSEQSISSFSDIKLTEQSSTRLFAIRQNEFNPAFDVDKSSAEQNTLTIFSNNSDFMVVSQYLYTQLSKVQADIPSSEVAANVFFKGWFFNSENALNGLHVSIDTENQGISLGLTAFSIGFCYVVLLLIIMPNTAKIKIKKLFIKQKDWRRIE